MSKSKKMIFAVGARASRLSVAQTNGAIAFLKRTFPHTDWRFKPFDTPGDRDLSTPLEKSAPDFFTRDLDDALRGGVIDCAIHSAKDMPGYAAEGLSMAGEGLDWFWLPEREDARDCWVWARGAPARVRRIGISSARRGEYAKMAFPHAKLLPVRGAIDSRLEQLAAGKFDALIMALAGIRRLYGDSLPHGLGMEVIDKELLPPPEAQGALAVTFRAGDERFLKLREHFVKAVRFVSAGTGTAALCTLAGLDDLANADVVLYDALMGEVDELKARLKQLNKSSDRPCRWVSVGKRCGAHSVLQPQITSFICDEARKLHRVVRLKGGDAGLFGRLAEETEALEKLRIPFVVRPGVSALTAATTGTGMLLTRRGESAGFSVYTPRRAGNEAPSFGEEASPVVMFMALKVASCEARRLISEGRDKDTACAIVFAAASARESIWRSTLGVLAASRPSKAIKELKLKEQAGEAGLFIVGSPARHIWPKLGILAGRRVLVTASEAIQKRVALAVEDRGGKAIFHPLIKLKARESAKLCKLARYDAIVFTSPSAVRIFFDNLTLDIRRLPKIFTCGAGTDGELRRHGVSSDLMPENDFSAAGLIREICRRANEMTGLRVLRFRSAKAGSAVARAFKRVGAKVDDFILYDNVATVGPAKSAAESRRLAGELPMFDAVHFASASAVEVFIGAYGKAAMKDKEILVMGEPTRAALPAQLRARAKIFETWK